MTFTAVVRDTGPDTYEMVLAHNLFRRIFGDLPYLISDVASGDLTRAGVLADAVVEFATVLHAHHRVEDEVLWPLLATRVADLELLAPDDQHQRVATLVDAALAATAVWRITAGGLYRDALCAVVTELDEVLRTHLADEERTLLPLAAQHLTATEWETLAEHGRAGISARRLVVYLGWVLDGLDPFERNEFLNRLPRRTRLAWRLGGRRRWRRERNRLYDL